MSSNVKLEIEQYNSIDCQLWLLAVMYTRCHVWIFVLKFTYKQIFQEQNRDCTIAVFIIVDGQFISVYLI